MRPSRDQLYISIALLMSTRATCIRRRVGCVLTDEKGHVLATGYNGRPAGFVHCIEGKDACSGAQSPSGTDLGGCEAIHAEQNALLQCKDVYSIEAAYCTTKPCIHCIKLLLNTSCQRIIYYKEYPHPEAEALWLKAGREIHQESIAF